MRAALARHDLAYVFQHLNSCGFSQRRIGHLTEQSQSEISEIIGGREVMGYAVLLRIADGLRIPRGYMGLGNYDYEMHTPVENALTVGVTGAEEAEEIRRSLQHAAEVMMGTSLPETSLWWQPLFRSRTPVTNRWRQLASGDGLYQTLRDRLHTYLVSLTLTIDSADVPHVESSAAPDGVAP
ncbi:hypothetical protein ACTOB_003611 [Actinoplanes oblitus]|uniref:HTH cro/C1-type domain-containing protein n=1 Tax=Actinoplanes oblitus TaxID=3040509 RepID=A0ABY8WPY4_9ACTN|nr:hypothetical protein [Actinoplanes oblitus]WIM99941.1 hypothetical protein ACTOB_003611 [Actinoplanes oblitus]